MAAAEVKTVYPCRPKREISEARREQLREAGRKGGLALVEKYGTAHMQEIGSAGYWATAQKFSMLYKNANSAWRKTNTLAFGQHYSKSAYKQLHRF
jgi:hypothetical protein